MREIKFRALGVGGNDGWFYGYFWKSKTTAFISNYESESLINGDFAVDKKTIGQFTGLKDKNGKEIYEGDIVKTEHGASGIVEWIDGVGYRFNCNEPMWRHPIREMGGEKEIIGNLYENPELI